MSKVVERTEKYERGSRTLALDACKVRLQESDHAVEEAINRRIEENGAYAFYFSEVVYNCSDGVVKVCGRVPTDRLKHTLWSVILDLDGVNEIDDQLDVVSSTGLSSIRPR